MPEDHNILDLLLDDQEQVTEKQKKILEAAVEIFSEKGYASTSTNEIAKKAGVAEGTIFRHYKTKKELLLSIVAPTMTKLIAPFIINDISKVLNTDYDRFEDFLRAVIENRRKFAKDNMTMIKILIQEIPFHPELKEQFMKNIGKKIFDRFTIVFEHYQAKGQIKKMPAESSLRLIGSTVIGYLMARYMIAPDFDWDDEQEINRMISFIMNGINAE
ncbi:TetR/AcrR family transcriptional regulator [Falsibacillus albus]|uniref:TetR/AcrR family transcriptional regulator n=1 Tax=Falsibacillus albus TaxID=2478915 RepID=A0A3L7JSH3_9BACI|nr:TetR/AcrR family transcriptional regulator [Falsibacillus albus]RLQ93440.1 TetR/AcrR family transcriptional regulator [Falsibacillus albus]